MVEQGGILVSVSGTVLIDGGVDAETASNGVLVAGLDNGNFELLDEESGASDVQASTVTDEASALEALRTGDQVEVYATYQDRDVPVFYSFAVPVLTELPPSFAVAQATGLDQSSLLLASVLLQGELVEQLPLSLPEISPGEETFVLFLSASQVQVQNRTAAPLGDEPDQTAVGPVSVARASALLGPPQSEQQSAFRLGVDEALFRYKVNHQFAPRLKAVLNALEEAIAPFKNLFQWQPLGADQEPPTPTSEPSAEPNKDAPAIAAEDSQPAREDTLEDPATLVPQTEPGDELFVHFELLPKSYSAGSERTETMSWGGSNSWPGIGGEELSCSPLTWEVGGERDSCYPLTAASSFST